MDKLCSPKKRLSYVLTQKKKRKDGYIFKKYQHKELYSESQAEYFPPLLEQITFRPH